MWHQRNDTNGYCRCTVVLARELFTPPRKTLSIRRLSRTGRFLTVSTKCVGLNGLASTRLILSVRRNSASSSSKPFTVGIQFSNVLRHFVAVHLLVGDNPIEFLVLNSSPACLAIVGHCHVATRQLQVQNDGGYPDGLVGENIPSDGWVGAIAGSYDAMTSSHPYREDMPQKKTVFILRDAAGTQWDLLMVDTFLCVTSEILEFQRHYRRTKTEPRRPQQTSPARRMGAPERDGARTEQADV